MYLRVVILLPFLLLKLVSATSFSTQGIKDLVKRRLPNHVDVFTFRLIEIQNHILPAVSSANVPNDHYKILVPSDGKILIEGNSPIALATGLHQYLKDFVNVDLWWVIGSRLDVGHKALPMPNSTITGSSIVPWRYHFNPATFSYTTAFWTWDDWELELDWLALRGVNLPLALVGQEKILIEVFRDIGLTDRDIRSYLSGPAFQAWNRRGNTQGSWSGDLSTEWIEGQFELQKKITTRMIDLGMTPILPCFSGRVPRGFSSAFPNSKISNNSRWRGLPDEYTKVSVLSSTDLLFERMQKSFIAKQSEALGNITHFYTLDQYNEQLPASGDLKYLKGVSYGAWKSLKAADPSAIWVMQASPFSQNPPFWTTDRVEAYLGGVEQNGDMLLLDLFAESNPVWNRLKGFFGKPWIWCQVHKFGGSMSFYGQITAITQDSINALTRSSSLVGFGLSMEAQQGNEIVYDLLLDQAWSKTPIETKSYFRNWSARRYSSARGNRGLMATAWEYMRTNFYDNQNKAIGSVPKSIFELSPSIEGLVERVGNQPTAFPYDLASMVQAFRLIYWAGTEDFSLWEDPAFCYDIIDAARQVLSGLFQTDYTEMITIWKANPRNQTQLAKAGERLISRLTTLDTVLSTRDGFTLSTWINAARSQTYDSSLQDIFEYNARLQITGWGPSSEMNDYASKAWGGLIHSYHIPRWQIFIKYLGEVEVNRYGERTLRDRLRNFEVNWQGEKLRNGTPGSPPEALLSILTAKFEEQITRDWLRTKNLPKA